MKRKLYNVMVFFFFVANVFAQKTDKKYQEKFYTNGDVEIEINASNVNVEVQNWNKNEVLVEASIEVEGVSKEEAEKYIDKWNFVALGNKSKVKINANGYFPFGFDVGKDFVFLNSKNNFFPKRLQFQPTDVVSLPKIDEIMVPKIDFDVDMMFENGEISKFKWKEGKHNYTIKSIKEWREFKKTEAYKDYLKNNKEAKTKMFFKKNRIKVIDKNELKKELKKAELEIKKLNKEEVKKALDKAKKQLNKTDLNYYFFSNDNSLFAKGKKVKIKKKIIIKAPKKSVLKLNTRHSKVKLPKSKVSGRVNYGTFNAENINGGKLTIHSSPVNINYLNNCELYLRNVEPAVLKTISNTNLDVSSSNVTINDIKKNVVIEDSFSNLDIKNVSSNFEKFYLDLNSSTANIKFADLKKRLNANFKKSGFSFPNSKPNMIYKDDGISATGNFKITTDDNSVKIKGKYSKVNIKN